ncbi:MAG: hypothetical protein HXS44_10415 [Theionarchaea archaeon]|nr:hypothetical protein [Theionarchaea archaeon]
MFAQLATSGTGQSSQPAFTCWAGPFPNPSGVCLDYGAGPYVGSCIDTGFAPVEEGAGCFFGQSPV